jgi:hypothetical protein
MYSENTLQQYFSIKGSTMVEVDVHQNTYTVFLLIFTRYLIVILMCNKT